MNCQSLNLNATFFLSLSSNSEPVMSLIIRHCSKMQAKSRRHCMKTSNKWTLDVNINQLLNEVEQSIVVIS